MSKQSTATRKSLPISKIVCLVVVVFSLAFGGFFFYKYQDINSKYKEVTQSKEDKIKSLVKEIGALYNIPKFEDEQPSFPGVEGTAIYTLVEQELENVKKSNEFYKDAVKDDVLIAYKNANTAILYRPSEKRIIKTGAYSEASLVKINTVVQANPDKVKELEVLLQQKFGKQINVIPGSAPSISLQKGIVVDLSGKSAEDAKKIAAAIGYDISTLPSGMTPPENALFLIIAPAQ